VVTALLDLGIETNAVKDGALGARGVAVMDAAALDGRSLQIKVYGRDAWDGQLLNSTWSYLWYRDEAPSLTLSRLQQVEHEAFLTLLAERAGVPVLPVVAAGTAEEDAILVVETRGRFLARSARPRWVMSWSRTSGGRSLGCTRRVSRTGASTPSTSRSLPTPRG
jgi:hypothetical protein